MDTRLSSTPVASDPLISIVIPVGGNRSSDIYRLTQCLMALSAQTYHCLEVILVIESDNDAVKKLSLPDNVCLVDFCRPPEFQGRDTVSRLRCGWAAAHGGILAATNVTIIWPPNLVAKALALLNQGHQAVDGITRRVPEDRSFIGLFQDHALLTEFPLYRRDHALTSTTFNSDMRLPTLTSFFMTRQFYEQVCPALDLPPEPGWEDFNLVRSMVEAGGEIYCTNSLISYRNHQPRLRLGKQFTAGIGGANFWINHPDNPYAKLRLRMALVSGLALTMGFLTLTISLPLNPQLTLIFIAAATLLLALAGIYNARSSHLYQAILFPPITALQVILWLAGFVYALTSDEVDPQLVAWVEARR